MTESSSERGAQSGWRDDSGETLIETVSAIVIMAAIVLPLIAAIGLGQASGAALQADASVDIPRASVRTALESYHLPYTVSPVTSTGGCSQLALTQIGKVATDALAITGPTLVLTPGQSMSYALWVSYTDVPARDDSFLACPTGLGRQPTVNEAVRGIRVAIPVTATYDKVTADADGRTSHRIVTLPQVAPVSALVPGSVLQ